MRYLIGIDNGGTFSKVGVFNEEGEQISIASVSTEVLTPQSGFTERDMTKLWENNVRAIKLAIEKSKIDPSDIAGVSLSGHGKGIYMIDKYGKPSYNGIVSTDNRAWEYVKRWSEDGTSEKIYQKTYQKILACQPISILAWFKDYKPEVLEQTRYIFSVKDYIRYMLTGEAYGEYTDFSGCNLINLNTGEYDIEILKLLNLEEIYNKLPKLKKSNDICGYITKEVSMSTLIPEGTPVAGGMFDVNACGISSGLINENEMCMIAGTWSINEFIKKEPIKNKSIDLNSMFCIPGYFLIEESSPTSAGNLEWFIKTFMQYEVEQCKKEDRSIYDVINKFVDNVDSEELNLYYLPFINGSNVNSLAKGTFIGLTAYHKKQHMLRAIYEGVVFSHYMHFEKLLKNREKPKTIRLAGGAANSDVWVQIFSDALGVPIEVVEDQEHGAKGAAISAGIACGIYKDYEDAIIKTLRISKIINPDESKFDMYRKKYINYCNIIQDLDETWHKIHKIK